MVLLLIRIFDNFNGYKYLFIYLVFLVSIVINNEHKLSSASVDYLKPETP